MEKILERYKVAFYLLEERSIDFHRKFRLTDVFRRVYNYSDMELDYAVKHFMRRRFYNDLSLEDSILKSPVIKQYLYEIHYRLNNNTTI